MGWEKEFLKAGKYDNGKVTRSWNESVVFSTSPGVRDGISNEKGMGTVFRKMDLTSGSVFNNFAWTRVEKRKRRRRGKEGRCMNCTCIPYLII